MLPNPQFPADLVTFTEEILNGKLHFLRNDSKKTYFYSFSKCSERRCITAFHKIRFS